MTEYTVTYQLKNGKTFNMTVQASCTGNAAARVIARTKAVRVTHIEKRNDGN